MGIPVLILGESGSGKSSSLRNFNFDGVAVFNVAGKPFPFRKEFKKINHATYDIIEGNLKAAKYKAYVIDDSQYLMTFEMFNRVKDKGYDKFTEISLNFVNLVKTVIKDIPDNVIVYFLHHTESLDNGNIKAKTIGKMIDNHLTLEGLFSIVLLAKVKDGKYIFETQSNGFTTAKSPIGMFDREIDNDLQAVDLKIREYWQLDNNQVSQSDSVIEQQIDDILDTEDK